MAMYVYIFFGIYNLSPISLQGSLPDTVLEILPNLNSNISFIKFLFKNYKKEFSKNRLLRNI